jgi:hypothetical protein
MSLQRLLGPGRHIQHDRAVQHPGNLDRIADMRSLIAHRPRNPISGNDNTAPLAQRPFRRSTQLAQVAAGV